MPLFSKLYFTKFDTFFCSPPQIPWSNKNPVLLKKKKKSVMLLHTNCEPSENEINKIVSFKIVSKRVKYVVHGWLSH